MWVKNFSFSIFTVSSKPIDQHDRRYMYIFYSVQYLKNVLRLLLFKCKYNWCKYIMDLSKKVYGFQLVQVIKSLIVEKEI